MPGAQKSTWISHSSRKALIGTRRIPISRTRRTRIDGAEHLLRRRIWVALVQAGFSHHEIPAAHSLLGDVLARECRTARQALIPEREHLRPLPAHRPETCRVLSCVADKYAHVRVDRSTYSLLTQYARRVVTCKVFHDRIDLALDAEVIARHARSFRDEAVVIDPLHVLKLLEQKHRAVGKSMAIGQWEVPTAFYELREKLRAQVRKPDQEWIRVLRLLETQGMAKVEAAMLGALERDSPRLQTVQMLLRQNSSDPSRPEPVTLEREDLAALDVAIPDLAAWDILCPGGKQ